MEGCGNIQREGEERTITLDRELINIQEGGTSDFNQLINRPSYDGERMTGNTNIPEVPTAISQLTNDSGYQTGDQVESTVQQAVGAVTDDLADEITAREQADTALNLAIGDETTARQLADTNLQGQIDAITASSDVKDIVGTKAELNNYDTSTLGNNDIIKVLQDESEGNATTYYRWSTATEQFTLIGEEGPYYTKSQADTLLNAKQNTLTAGSNVQIVGDTISATDTTYTAGNGLNLTGTEFSADTTVLATQTDLAGKQNTLTAGAGIDITNDVISATGGGGPTVVQTTGTSTTDVMSQNAVTSMVYADPAARQKVSIGAIQNNGSYGTAIGYQSQVFSGNRGVAIGYRAEARANGAVAIGTGATAANVGEVNIGSSASTAYGYNNSNYRLLSGLYDPQNAHDAANKQYVDAAIAALEARIAALEGN